MLFFIGACISGKDYLLLRQDKNDRYCYINSKGDTVIAPGKYLMCYTDTFRNFAIVEKPYTGFIGINRDEKVLFEVFIFDNGPDDISEGYFRITRDGKIGYADRNGDIKISPQFGCAFPFQNGIAKVGRDCKTIAYGEHSAWVTDAWFYINKSGKQVKPVGTDGQ